MFRRARSTVRPLTCLMVAALLGMGMTATATASSQRSGTKPQPDSASAPREAISGIDPNAAVDSVIKGLVYNQNGRRLDNINVEAVSVQDPTADPVASALTYQAGPDSHGAYELHVPAGTYRVRFSSPDHAVHRVFETVYYGGGAGTDVTVGSAETTTLDPVTLVRDRGVPLSGTVVDQNGDPITGVRVGLFRFFGDGQPGDVGLTATDAGGRYTFEGVNRDRTYSVVAYGMFADDGTYRGLPDVWLGDADTVDDARRVTIPADSQGQTLDAITMRPGLDVHGSVTGYDLRSDWVQVYLLGRNADGSLSFVDAADLDDNGGFRFQRVARGASYTVDFHNGTKDTDTYLGGVADEKAATIFTAAAGDTSIDVGTTDLGHRVSHVTGSVLDGDGDPATDYTYMVWRLQKDGTFEQVPGVGRYDTIDLDLGWGHTYTVEATPYGADHGVFLGGASSPAEATTFSTDADHSDITLEPIVLGSAYSHKLVGHVVDDLGNPVAGARVTLFGQYCPDASCSFGNYDTTRTDGNGRYVWHDLATGHTYTVSADVDWQGYPRSFVGDAPDAATATHYTIPSGPFSIGVDDITLRAATGVVLGSVHTSDDADYTGTVTVDLYRMVDRGDGAYRPDYGPVGSTSAVDGKFGFTDVDPGDYTVRTQYLPGWDEPAARYVESSWRGGAYPQRIDAPGVFHVGAEVDPLRGVDVTLQRGVELSGKVTGSTGGPLDGVAVSVTDPDNQGWTGHIGYATTDESGHYAIRVPAAATVAIRADRVGYAVYPSDTMGVNQEVNDTDVELDFSMQPDWTGVGTVAGTHDEYCLAHVRQDWINNVWLSDRVINFDGAHLGIWANGTISEPNDRGRFIRPVNPLRAGSQAAVLAPLTGTGGAGYSETWGVSEDGNTLCALWRNRSDGAVFQALLTKADGGGLDVTYNYDILPPADSGTVKAGYTEGNGTHGAPVAFDGSQLLTGQLNSDRAGRYTFHFDGFDKSPAPEMQLRPSLTGEFDAGGRVTLDPGVWTVDGKPSEDIELDYRWHNVAGTPDGMSYTIQREDLGRHIWASVSAWAPGREFAEIRTATRRVAGQPAAVNTTAPTLSPDAPSAGQTLTADVGAWTVADGSLDDVAWGYRWLRNGRVIDGETGATYHVRAQDALRRIAVQVSATRPGYATVWASSQAVTVAELPQVVLETVPQVSGDAKVGETLQVSPGTWDAGEDSVALSYRWVVGYQTRTADADSNGTALTLQEADRGQYVTAYVTAAADNHRPRTWSTTLGPVAQHDASTGTLTIKVVRDDGSAVSGAWVQACGSDTWTCLPGGATDSDGRLSAVAISGVTYHVHVWPPDVTLHPADSTVTMPAAGDGSATVELVAPAPPPPNVSIPTSYTDNAGTPVVHWQDDQQFEVTGCATVTDPTYTVTFSDGNPSRTGSLVSTALGNDLAKYSAAIPAFYPAHGDTTISTNVPADCEAGTPPTSVEVYIDPSGVVTDQYGRPIDGATVTLLRSSVAGGPYAAVPDGSTVMSQDNRSNPSITGADGFFRWDVTEGWYRVRATAPGCTQVTSDPMQVLPARVDLLLKLSCTSPADSVVPTIVGAPSVGSTLTTDTSSWGDVYEVTVQWMRDGQPIVGATNASYVVTSSDAGKSITVRQIADRPDYVQEQGRGTPVDFTSTSATSAPLVIPAAPTPGGGGGSGGGGSTGSTTPTASTPPVLTGAGKVGTVLSVTAPVWNVDSVTDARQWYRDDAPIDGAHDTSYLVTPDDVDHVITVRFTGTKAGLSEGTTSSNGIRAVKGDAAMAPAPLLHGVARTGQSLTVDEPAWQVAGVESRYQWMRDGIAIAGATRSSYTLVASDVGKAISAVVAGVRSGYEDGSVSSASVTGALGDASTSTSEPSISGGHRVGSRLEVDKGVWPHGVKVRVTWLRDGKAVGHGSSYRVRVADAGRRLSALMTATRAGYADGSATTRAIRVQKLESRVELRLGSRHVTKDGHGVLRVTVNVEHLHRVVGVLQVLDGGRLLRSVSVRGSDHEVRTIRLPLLTAGQHPITVRYAGNERIAGATSSAEVLRVD